MGSKISIYTFKPKIIFNCYNICCWKLSCTLNKLLIEPYS